MTSPQCDTSDTLTRARVSVLFHPKKAPPVTLTCPKCGHAVTLEVPGTAYCRPCKQPMRPEGEGVSARNARSTTQHRPESALKRGATAR